MAKGFLQYAKEIINDALSSSNTTYDIWVKYTK